MDLNEICCMGIIIVFILAAVINFWPSGPADTYIDYFTYSNNQESGTLFVKCIENSTKGHDEALENATILVNLTDSNNTTTKYNVTTDDMGFGTIINLPHGKYNMSAYYAGNESYKPSAYNGTLELYRNI